MPARAPLLKTACRKAAHLSSRLLLQEVAGAKSSAAS